LDEAVYASELRSMPATLQEYPTIWKIPWPYRGSGDNPRSQKWIYLKDQDE